MTSKNRAFHQQESFFFFQNTWTNINLETKYPNRKMSNDIWQNHTKSIYRKNRCRASNCCTLMLDPCKYLVPKNTIVPTALANCLCFSCVGSPRPVLICDSMSISPWAYRLQWCHQHTVHATCRKVIRLLPSGNWTVCYWKLPSRKFVDLPSYKWWFSMVFPLKMVIFPLKMVIFPLKNGGSFQFANCWFTRPGTTDPLVPSNLTMAHGTSWHRFFGFCRSPWLGKAQKNHKKSLLFWSILDDWIHYNYFHYPLVI